MTPALLFLATSAVAGDLTVLDEALADLAARDLFVGEVVVAHDGVITHRYATADLPAHPIFRIGSMTKAFTAATVLALADDGRLSIDDPASKHLPELAAQLTAADGTPVTLRHLLHHTAGIGDVDIPPWSREPTFAEVSPLLVAGLAVTNPPGTVYAYSNTGYFLLGEVVRRATGTPWETFLRTRLLDGLGMPDTRMHPDEARRVPGHVSTPIGLLDVMTVLPRLVPYDYRWDLATDGGLSSTPDDLVRWATALRRGEVLSDAARLEMLTPALDGYGCGWIIDGDRVWHNGALSPIGIYGYLRWSRTDDEVVVALSGVDVDAISPELRSVVEAALEGEPIPVAEGPPHPTGILAMLAMLRVPELIAFAGIALHAAIATRLRRWTAVGSGLTAAGWAAAWLSLSSATLAVAGGLLTLVHAGWVARDRPAGGLFFAVVGLFPAAMGAFVTWVFLWNAGHIRDPWGFSAP